MRSQLAQATAKNKKTQPHDSNCIASRVETRVRLDERIFGSSMAHLSGLSSPVGANPNLNKSVVMTLLAQLADSVSSLSFSPKGNFLVATSWDHQVRCWEIGSSVPKAMILHDEPTEFKRITSPFKYQTKCVAAFPDHQGFLVGSIEGKVGVLHVDDSQQSKNFTFKCHRHENEIYTINSLNFHPVHHTFATAGSDGAFNFWDKDSKKRLMVTARFSQSIRCSTFNSDGSIFAFAVGYDWSMGPEYYNPAENNYILLHTPQESEVKL
ncbi:hypothetical protein MRB53_034212 [Persea americana]|uniref:Uncharacterized protein n=1 Tax=Persea americana TaxID=3435 RepID=A0ACC2KXX5_PERAE|nr:hypothetical protein MRB53_034212 [Persea americana]